MTVAPDNEQNQSEADAEKQADAIQGQLRKDVASWSAARSARSSRDTAEASVPPPKRPVAARAKAPRRAPVQPVEAVDAVKKPFRMSYDGVSEAEYISYIIQRGA